ncbi:MAG: hypothetical protein BWZ10_02996 [candidate division BRC1 bacterium ADurb.BinA364]|nr:MAG: hypothetical protein BWZ10_02996 [candidate division BRC1 bacterium ADurb.BinA364]
MAEAKVKHPDEAEIDKRYLETIGRFARSGGWECRLVRLYAIRRPDGQLAPVPLSAADECLGALVAKEPEEAIASRMQDHGIAVAYGEPTFVSYRGAPDGWAAPMREAKPRQWIGPFAEQDGWMLMQALEPISEGHWPLESVRPALECELKREARERARRLVLERELASIEAMDIESGGKAASRKPN